MLELFKYFSFPDYVLFFILILLSFRGVFSFIEWGQNEGLKIFKNKYQKPKEIENQVHDLTDKINKIANNVDLLIRSDKDDIKAFITREHHYFYYQLQEIDDQSLDCIQKRYAHYKDQGGNSYVQNLMKDLRRLPKVMPAGNMKKYHNLNNTDS